MKDSRKVASALISNPTIVGSITILVLTVAVYLSYVAENGFPFVPAYTVNVDVQSAAELTKNSDVRIGGARVGQVLKITPYPAGSDPGYPRPFARLQLQLQKSLMPLAYDTRFEVRLASVLGGKYLELVPGSDRNTPRTPAVPDGGTFALGTREIHSISVVDIDTAFGTFGPKTAAGLRNVTGQLGDALAGRGVQLNDAILALHGLIGPLDNLLRLVSSPRTHLSQFISGAAATTSVLAPLAPTIDALLSNGARTLDALQGSALGATIDALPPTEAEATTVLSNARPVLAQAATIVQALKPGAALLPRAGQRLDELINAATPVFRQAPRLASRLQGALAAVNRLSHDPATVQTFKILGTNDLATFGASAFVGLGAILEVAAPGQLGCNLEGIWAANFGGANNPLSEGDATGSWLRTAPLIDPSTGLESPKPSSTLHLNPYPRETQGHCESGNEPYAAGQTIGNPPGFSGGVVPSTSPPAGVLGRARAAGLLGDYR